MDLASAMSSDGGAARSYTAVVAGGIVRFAVVALLFAIACDPPTPGDARRALLADEIDLLDTDAERRISMYLDWVRRERGIDFQVVIDSLDGDSPEARSSRLFQERAPGRTTGGKGLLLLVDPRERQVRVEVGYALEPQLTDVDASRMLTDYLAPYFRSREPAAGIEASIEALIEKLDPPLRAGDADSGAPAPAEEGAPRERAAERPNRAAAAGQSPIESASGGAGASLDLLRELPAGALDDAARAELLAILVPQPGPRQARDLEIALLERGLYLQEAALYDEAWRRAARPGAWSPARLREIARQWDRPYEVVVEDPLAIAYYPDAPALGPVFLRRVERGWTIDASQGARSIVYDYSNEGWYALDDGSPYLALLRRALPLERVTLQGGRAAWQME